MTISTTTRKAGPYLGTGLVSAYLFAFTVLAAADVLVTVRDTSQVETVLADPADYTVALNADQNSSPGGTVTLTAPLTDGYYLVITSDQPATQPVDLISQGGFYPDVIDEALDRQTILVQQLEEEVGRALKVPVSSGPSTVLDLPVPEANTVIGWDLPGISLRNWSPAELAIHTDFGDAVVTSLTAITVDTALAGPVDLLSNGGFNIAAGKTLTINGPFRAPLHRVFFGSGAVVFGADSVAEVFPQWWGAKGDGVVDDAPAFRAAVIAITTTGGKIKVPAGLYRLASCDAAEITKDERCAFILKDNMKVIGDGGAKLWLDGNTLKDVAPFNAGSRFSFIGVLQGAVNCEIGHLEFTSNGWVLDITFRSYNAVACMGDRFWIHDLYMKNLPGRNMIRVGNRNPSYPAYIHISKNGVIERITCINGNQNVPGNTVADDCSFFYMESDGTHVKDVVIKNDSLIPGAYCGGIEMHGDRIVVDSCTFENLTPALYSGNVGEERTGNTVRDCLFNRCSGGVSILSKLDHFTVSGNLFLDTGISGDIGMPVWCSIWADRVKHLRIENNTIVSTTPEARPCFSLPSIQGGILSGNIVRGRTGVASLGITPGEPIDGVIVSKNVIIPETNYPAFNVGIISIDTAASGNTETVKNIEVFENFYWVPAGSSRFNLAVCIDNGGTTNTENINFFNNRMINGGLNSVWGTGAALVSGNISSMGEKRGATASVADGGTITHGLGATPVVVIAVGSVAGEMVSVTAKSSTTFTVAIKKNDGTAGTSQTIYWQAWI